MAKAGVPKQKPAKVRNVSHRAEVERKRAEAKARQEKFSKLTPQQRLAKLDAGNRYSSFKPLAAVKERAKLAALIEPAIVPGDTTVLVAKSKKGKKGR